MGVGYLTVEPAWICELVCFAFLLVFAVTDGRRNRIPNTLVIIFLIAGMVRSVLFAQAAELLWQLGAIAFLYLVGPVLIAPGDCKMCMGVVAFSGIPVFLVSFFAAEIIMLPVFALINAKAAGQEMANIGMQLMNKKNAVVTGSYALAFAPFLAFAYGGTCIWQHIFLG